MRIEYPLYLASVGRERENAVELRADIDRVVGEDRRGLEVGLGRNAELLGGPVAGVYLPRDLQVFHILRRDLCGESIARCTIQPMSAITVKTSSA
jgi:hypothetical protein